MKTPATHTSVPITIARLPPATRSAIALATLLLAANASGVDDLATPQGGAGADSAAHTWATTDLPPSEWGRLESDRKVVPAGHQPAGRATRGERPGSADAAWSREIEIRYEPSAATFWTEVDAALAARQCPASSTARRLVVATDGDLGRPAAPKRQRVYAKTACAVAATMEDGNDE